MHPLGRSCWDRRPGGSLEGCACCVRRQPMTVTSDRSCPSRGPSPVRATRCAWLAPESYARAVATAGFVHEPCADAPPELIGPVMGSLPSMTLRGCRRRGRSGRCSPGSMRRLRCRQLIETIERWRPDLVLRESAELASLAAAERAGVPHVHVCIGMHEVVSRFAEAIAEPLEELGRLAGPGRGSAGGGARRGDDPQPRSPRCSTARVGRRCRREAAASSASTSLAPPPAATACPGWGDPDAPLVYVTFGSVTGSLPPFAGAFREALDALAGLEARVLMTVGRTFDLGRPRAPADQRPRRAVVAPGRRARRTRRRCSGTAGSVRPWARSPRASRRWSCRSSPSTRSSTASTSRPWAPGSRSRGADLGRAGRSTGPPTAGAIPRYAAAARRMADGAARPAAGHRGGTRPGPVSRDDRGPSLRPGANTCARYAPSARRSARSAPPCRGRVRP